MEDEKETKEEKIENTEEIQGNAEENQTGNTGENVKEDHSAENEAHEDEKKYSQAELDKAVNKALARKLPPKKEMEEFMAWKKSQQTEAEKAEEREKKYRAIEDENTSLKHENAVIKAGVNADSVDFVLFKVEKMEGDFNDNLKDFLSENGKYTAPKTKTVEGAEHKTKSKESTTRADLDKMTYKERLAFKQANPAAYASAMGNK